MSEVYIKEGINTISKEHFTISVKLELTDVSDIKSKKKITIFFKSKYGLLVVDTISPRRSANTSQALASHLSLWLRNSQKFEFGQAQKIGWALARQFEV